MYSLYKSLTMMWWVGGFRATPKTELVLILYHSTECFNVLYLIVDALTTLAVLHWITFIDGVRLSLSLFNDKVC